MKCSAEAMQTELTGMVCKQHVWDCSNNSEVHICCCPVAYGMSLVLVGNPASMS